MFIGPSTVFVHGLPRIKSAMPSLFTSPAGAPVDLHHARHPVSSLTPENPLMFRILKPLVPLIDDIFAGKASPVAWPNTTYAWPVQFRSSFAAVLFTLPVVINVSSLPSWFISPMLLTK
jgi:hypothetical protein